MCHWNHISVYPCLDTHLQSLAEVSAFFIFLLFSITFLILFHSFVMTESSKTNSFTFAPKRSSSLRDSIRAIKSIRSQKHLFNIVDIISHTTMLLWYKEVPMSQYIQIHRTSSFFSVIFVISFVLSTQK